MPFHQTSVAELLDRSTQTQPHFRDRTVLLYSRPAGDFPFQDSQLEFLRDEYRRRLRIEISSPAEAARTCKTWVSTIQPTFLFLRRNRIISAAIGRLSTCGLKSIVRAAIN